MNHSIIYIYVHKPNKFLLLSNIEFMMIRTIYMHVTNNYFENLTFSTDLVSMIRSEGNNSPNLSFSVT